MVAPVTEMIESVLREARKLLVGTEEDPAARPLVILFHGQQHDNNDLEWIGPYHPDEVDEHIDEEMLAGAAIVFAQRDVIIKKRGVCMVNIRHTSDSACHYCSGGFVFGEELVTIALSDGHLCVVHDRCYTKKREAEGWRGQQTVVKS